MPASTAKFDAAIVGGGVIGCAIAWRLGQHGLRVVVIERGKVGREASLAAGGMLAPLSEADQADEFFQIAVKSRAMYSEFARELKEASRIDIEYRTEGTIYPALTDEDEEELERRWQWQHAANLNVKRLNAACALKLEPHLNDKIRWALKFPDDHQVNNRHLLLAIQAAAQNTGVKFSTYTEARQILTESHGARKKVSGVTSSRGEIKTGIVVVAAGSWSSLLSFDGGRAIIEPEIEPVRGQMVTVEMPAPAVRHVIYTRRGYLVPRYAGFLIAGSTTEHVGYDKRVTAGGITAIVDHATEILPGFINLAIKKTWAGLRPRAADDLPILGPDPNVSGLVYATGHYRNGILLTPITAQAISELIIKGESSISLEHFSVGRFSRNRAAGNTAWQ